MTAEERRTLQRIRVKASRAGESARWILEGSRGDVATESKLVGLCRRLENIESALAYLLLRGNPPPKESAT